MAAASVFSGLARDAAAAAEVMDFRRDGEGITPPGGKVLFHSTFNDGFAGWRDHFDDLTPVLAISRTAYPVFQNDLALKLATGSRAYDAANHDIATSTYKNLSLYRTTGLTSMSAWLCVGNAGNGAEGHYTYSLAMDIQKWDNTSRSFPRLYCVQRADGRQEWAIENDANGLVTIPGSLDNAAGQNENKFNWNFVRLTWDLDANGGLGGYHEAQVNNELYDLRALGGGSASHDPQAGSANTDFRGGLNFGLTLRSTFRYPDRLGTWLVADSIVGTIQD